MSNLMRDVRHASRRLLRAPLFTLATLLTLALGIGANTAIFTVVNGVLLRSLPFPEPDRLAGVWQSAPGVDIKDLPASFADYLTYREHSTALADVALWNRTSATVLTGDVPERVDGLLATVRLLPLLGVQPILGRPFAESDDVASSPQVVMLGHGYWQRRFGGDRDIVGSRISIDGSMREVIGGAAAALLVHGRRARRRDAAALRSCHRASGRLQLPSRGSAAAGRHAAAG